MRLFLLTAALVFAVSVAPANAQSIANAPGRQAPVAVYDSPAVPSLGQLFNAQTLRFGQSYEMSYAGGAGGSLGLGVYTASLQWQPSSKLAGRVDIGLAHSPFGSGAVRTSLGFDDAPGRVFLRNAELAYRPTANSSIHLSVQQSPYGAYASPYGQYGGYGAGYGRSAFSRSQGFSDSDRLFFRDGQ
jgi:hypothetical protein